jgi:hypothetical protein
MDEAVAEGVTGHLTDDPFIHLYSGLHSQRLFGLFVTASERCKAIMSHVDIRTHINMLFRMLCSYACLYLYQSLGR